MLAEMKRPKKYINKWPKIVRQYVARKEKKKRMQSVDPDL